MQRAVRIRAGDECEYPGCHHRHFLEFAHKTPHCKGGAREAGDLLLLCPHHHLLFDASTIKLLRDDPDEIVFEDAFGYETATKRTRDPPPWLCLTPGTSASVCLPPVIRDTS